MVPQNIRLDVDKKSAQFPLSSPINNRFQIWETNIEFFTLLLGQCLKIWSKNSEKWQELILLTHPNLIHSTLPRNRHHSLTLRGQIQLLISTFWQCCQVLPFKPSAWQPFDRE